MTDMRGGFNWNPEQLQALPLTEFARADVADHLTLPGLDVIRDPENPDLLVADYAIRRLMFYEAADDIPVCPLGLADVTNATKRVLMLDPAVVDSVIEQLTDEGQGGVINPVYRVTLKAQLSRRRDADLIGGALQDTHAVHDSLERIERMRKSGLAADPVQMNQTGLRTLGPQPNLPPLQPYRGLGRRRPI